MHRSRHFAGGFLNRFLDAIGLGSDRFHADLLTFGVDDRSRKSSEYNNRRNFS